jgi:hypothetical protein
MDSSTSSTAPAPLTLAEQAELDMQLYAAARCFMDNANRINNLIQSGANANAKAKDGSDETALMAACKGGHLNIVKALIPHLDVPALNAVDSLGHPALRRAAGYGEPGRALIVAALINAGADVHQRINGTDEWINEDALARATRYVDGRGDKVAFQLLSAMPRRKRNDTPYRGRSVLQRLLWGALPGSEEALVRYQVAETELRQRVVNISAGLSAGQNAPNNLGNITEVLALIAEYAFSNCLVNGQARREVIEAMRTITPPPSVMFSVGRALAPLRRRVSNLATEAVDRTIRHFIHAASIPSVIPCPVPAIEDKRAEQGPSKKPRR